MESDAHYRYHLNRVVTKFATIISADNAELLARLLGNDEG